MNQGRITEYTGDATLNQHITTYMSATYAPPIYPDWTNIASRRLVRAIALAPEARSVWLATSGGVITWSPKEEMIYRCYSSEHGLAGNATTCICVDETERLWVGHIEHGLSYFEDQHWHSYPYLQDQVIRIACPALQGGIWAASADSTYYVAGSDCTPVPVAVKNDASFHPLALLDLESTLLVGNIRGLFRVQANKEPVQLAASTIETCTALTKDYHGHVWIGTPEGVYRLEDEDVVGPILPEDDDASRNVQALAASRDCLWMLTPTGLARILEERWSSVLGISEPLPRLQTIAALPDENVVWVGTDRLLTRVQVHGVAQPVWNTNWLPLQREDDLNNLGRCIAQEPFKGSIWIGTAGGLLDITPEGLLTNHKEMGDVRALSLAISESETILWSLSWPQGIRHWSALDRSTTPEIQALKLPIAIVTGRDGYQYVLAGNALWCVTPNKTCCIACPLPSTARCLAQTFDGRWWVGTAQGIYCLVAARWELVGEQPGPRQGGVRALVVIRQHLWAATETGLWQLKEEHWQSYKVSPNDSLCDIRTLAEASQDGVLWLARREGIVQYHLETRMLGELYTPRNSGLGSCNVTALAEINNLLWIVTQAGISCLRLSGG